MITEMIIYETSKIYAAAEHNIIYHCNSESETESMWIVSQNFYEQGDVY